VAPHGICSRSARAIRASRRRDPRALYTLKITFAGRAGAAGPRCGLDGRSFVALGGRQHSRPLLTRGGLMVVAYRLSAATRVPPAYTRADQGAITSRNPTSRGAAAWCLNSCRKKVSGGRAGARHCCMRSRRRLTHVGGALGRRVFGKVAPSCLRRGGAELARARGGYYRGS